MPDNRQAAVQTSIRNEKRSWIARIGGGIIILGIILIFLGKYTIDDFRGMTGILSEINDTEIDLMKVATNLENHQLEQHLYLVGIFRIGASQKEDVSEDLNSFISAFEAYGDQFEEEIQRGIAISEKAMEVSEEAAEKYMKVNIMLTSLQDDHDTFEANARAVIGLIESGEYREARSVIAQIEDDVQAVSHNAQRLGRDIELYIERSVVSAEQFAATATKNHTVLAVIGIALLIVFGIYVMIFMLRYITDLKTSEEELRKHRDELEELVKERSLELTRQKDQLDFLIENMPDRIYFKDTEGRFIRVNKAVASRYGIDDPRQMIGKSDFDFYDHKRASEWQTIEQDIINNDKAISGVEECEVWHDGKKTWASITKMPLRDHEGTIIGVFGITRDITARKEAEIELKRIAGERG